MGFRCLLGRVSIGFCALCCLHRWHDRQKTATEAISLLLVTGLQGERKDNELHDIVLLGCDIFCYPIVGV